MKKNVNRLIRVSSVVLIFLIAYGCDSVPGEGDRSSGEKPKETISLERAHAMFEAYQERFDVVTEFREGREDARYGWHSLEFYENYIAYLKLASRKAGIKVSGIRMYYVAYPEDDQAGEYRGYQTYIYVPTYYDEKSGDHIAFDPLHIGNDGVPLPIHDVIVNGKKRSTDKAGVSEAAMARSMAETESSIANMGEMCEPNCPEEVGSGSN
ncbi:hypothetical protein JMN32_26905 [Fulvivirga sp. 29W222]|uniref:Lipoprotein n=1 Tax=Fulvivirga marina TaxID=2494733 RepID=A0A937KEP3_9BACT|nr:hypothetical protein [Fulvivirga marina]MBL6449972.1 hypothetical protein [Fulvivirga marina]